jgi:hypothetical protein
MNFSMQANGAEILRLACCLATERGLTVCAPVHGAILIEAPAVEIDSHVAALQACMREASRVMLGGLELGSEAKIVGWPDRYTDKWGEEMWTTVTRLLEDLENNCDRYIVALSGRLGSPRDRLARSIFPDLVNTCTNSVRLGPARHSAELVVRCRRKVPSGWALQEPFARYQRPGRGYELSASHH